MRKAKKTGGNILQLQKICRGEKRRVRPGEKKKKVRCRRGRVPDHKKKSRRGKCTPRGRGKFKSKKITRTALGKTKERQMEGGEKKGVPRFFGTSGCVLMWGGRELFS